MTVKEKIGRKRYLFITPFNFAELNEILKKYRGKVINYKGQKFILLKHFNVNNFKKEVESKGIRIKRISGSLRNIYKKSGFD